MVGIGDNKSLSLIVWSEIVDEQTANSVTDVTSLFRNRLKSTQNRITKFRKVRKTGNFEN